MRWQIQLFGKVVARRGDVVEDRFATRKNAELLGYLAMSPGSAFSRQHLCNLLWPEATDVDAARVRLRQAISSIRRQLEPPGLESGSVVVAERDMVWLNRAEVESDVAEFELTLALVGSSSPDKLKRHLKKILDLHREEFMSGLTAEWIVTEQDRYHERFVKAANQLVELCFAEGDWKGAASALKRAAEIERYDEAIHCKLMTAYRYMGQLSEALGVYDKIESRLRLEIGVAPSKETRRLAESIRAEADSGIRPPIRNQIAAPLAEQREPARRFPAPSTRFFGRSQEVATLRTMIDDPGARLITLAGPGGVGKTRLALELAEQLFFDRSGDVWFVPLADLTLGQEIGSAIMTCLSADIQSGMGAVEAIAGQLSRVDRPVLILDNIEHILEDGARLVRQLLDRITNICCVVTSRQPLEIEGEHEVRIGLLSVPPVDANTPDQLMNYSSVQLFVDRAKLVRPDFQITPGNGAALADLCRQLEGIPLAIETCAALSQTIGPVKMVEGLNKRFELLVSRRRDIVPRHRTLRAAIEYSYRMLDPDLAFIFRQLAIYQGGWSLESAESMLGPINMQEALIQLQKLSLITSEEVSVNGQSGRRFRMLETFRVFAWEMLSNVEQERLAECHQVHFTKFAKDERESYYNNRTNVDALELEQANLTAAIRWHLAEGRLQDAMEVCNALFHFWMIKGRHAEGVFWFQSLLEHPQISSVPLKVRCRSARAHMHLVGHGWGIAEAAKSIDRYYALAEEVGEPAELVHALSAKGIFYDALGQVDTAIKFCETALEGARAIGDVSVGNTLTDLLDVHYRAGNYAKSIEYCAEAYPISTNMGFRLNACNTLGTWASSLAMLGEFEQARSKFLEGLDAATAMGAPTEIIRVQLGLAVLSNHQDRLREARAWLETALNLLSRTSGTREFRFGIHVAAGFAFEKGMYETAVLLSASAESLSPSNREPFLAAFGPSSEELRERAGARFEQLWAGGLTLDQRQMLDMAIETLAPVPV